jgi:hypothetical protein
MSHYAKTKHVYLKYAVDNLRNNLSYFKWQKHLSETLPDWTGHPTAHFRKKIRALEVAIPEFDAVAKSHIPNVTEQARADSPSPGSAGCASESKGE